VAAQLYYVQLSLRYVSGTEQQRSGCVRSQAFCTVCCGEVHGASPRSLCSAKSSFLLDFPEQSNRNEGKRERGLGRGKLGTLVPSPQGFSDLPAEGSGVVGINCGTACAPPVAWLLTGDHRTAIDRTS